MSTKRFIWLGVIIGLLLAALPSQAQEAMQQENWSIHYLPVSEAEALVRSALSDHGTVVALASRRLLIVSDDAAHLNKAKRKLMQFDRPSEQYRITLELLESSQVTSQSLQAAAPLPGNWLQVQLDLMPWLSRSQPGMPANAKPELLIGLGTATNINQTPTATDPSLRLNAAPQLTMPKPIRIAGAATQITVQVGEPVDIIANSGESELLTRTLLGRHSAIGSHAMVIRLRVSRP